MSSLLVLEDDLLVGTPHGLLAMDWGTRTWRRIDVLGACSGAPAGDPVRIGAVRDMASSTVGTLVTSGEGLFQLTDGALCRLDAGSYFGLTATPNLTFAIKSGDQESTVMGLDQDRVYPRKKVAGRIAGLAAFGDTLVVATFEQATVLRPDGSSPEQLQLSMPPLGYYALGPDLRLKSDNPREVSGIRDVFIASNGSLWVTHRLGVSVFARLPGRWRRNASALLENASFASALHETSGELWFATTEALHAVSVDWSDVSVASPSPLTATGQGPAGTMAWAADGAILLRDTGGRRVVSVPKSVGSRVNDLLVTSDQLFAATDLGTWELRGQTWSRIGPAAYSLSGHADCLLYVSVPREEGWREVGRLYRGSGGWEDQMLVPTQSQLRLSGPVDGPGRCAAFAMGENEFRRVGAGDNVFDTRLYAGLQDVAVRQGLAAYIATTDFLMRGNGQRILGPGHLDGGEVIGVALGDSGHVWLALSNGLALANPVERSVRRPKGPFLEEIAPTGAPLIGTDSIFVPTGAGLVAVARSLFAERAQPGPDLVGLRADEESIDLRSQGELPSLGGGWNNLTLAFRVRDSIQPHRYQMSVAIPEWGVQAYASPWPDFEATFAIPEGWSGRFTVLVQAITPGRQVSASSFLLDARAPLLRRPWMQLSLVLGLFGSTGAYALVQSRRRRRERERLSNHNRQLEAIQRAKNRFFANISHEFRTPLTLIEGPLIDAIPDSPSSTVILGRHVADRMVRHLRSLLGMVDDLLTFAKIEGQALAISVTRTTWPDSISGVVRSFQPAAERKGISLNFRPYPLESSLVFVDHRVVEQVIGNLISNAIKFTPSGGRVTVTLERGQQGFVRVTVRDTGVGIPPAQVQSVFERFHRVDRGARTPAGSGIGLALVKEVTEAVGGQVSVVSEPGRGSSFEVTLPVWQQPPANATVASNGSVLDQRRSKSGYQKGLAAPGTASRSVVLVVDDNPDVRDYVAEVLAPECRVFKAREGREALSLALKEAPDVIVSDVVMPGMDGHELVKSVRDSPELQLTPVLLLTARADEEDLLEGIGVGADVYLRKPFSARVLRGHVRQMTTRHREVRARLSADREAVTSSTESEFVSRARALIAEHVSDPKFNVARLASELAMSDRTLHRRLTSEVGCGPLEFMRGMRMQAAWTQLVVNRVTVAEAAERVGYNGTKAFRAHFRRQFGMSPSEARHGAPPGSDHAEVRPPG